MKLAIISTTIQGEKGYLPFDMLAAKSKFSEVIFVIAGDTTSKPFDVSKFKCKVEYLSPKDQERFVVSDIIGWKTPRRRPTAYLRAIELNPDYILTIDDDNIPPADYFEKWYEVLTTPKQRIATIIKGNENIHWHNYLKTSDGPIPVYPRGYPTIYRGKDLVQISEISSPIKPEEIGLFQGISLGDPDMDAMTKIVYEKRIQISKIEEKNYCLKNIWSPYNMQNTLLTKMLFPLPILWPSNGRFDDIYASYTWQQLIFNNDKYVHVGDPLNYQDRGVRDIFNADFKLESDGYVEAHEVWEQIKTIKETDGLKFLNELIELPHRAIQKEHKFFEAYRSDIVKIYAKK